MENPMNEQPTVAELGELDAALARAAAGESAVYIEVVGGRMEFPAGLAMAHQRLDALYGNGQERGDMSADEAFNPWDVADLRPGGASRSDRPHRRPALRV